MAFGFTPKFVHFIPLENLTTGKFIAIVAETIKQIGWSMDAPTSNSITAFSGMSLSSYGETIEIKIDNGIATIESKCTGNQMFDWGRNKRNVQNFLANFESVKEQKLLQNTSTEEDVQIEDAPIEEASAPLEKNTVSVPNNRPAFLSMFVPTDGYFVTPIVIIINILVFIFMVVSGVDFFLPSTESLIQWGANFKPVTLEGQWWRLLTCCFLHIGLIHLLLNMYALLYIGILLEPLLGKERFIAAYLLTGICSSVTSLWWHDLTVSAGASGAIFGMYGVFLAMLTTNFIDRAARKALLTSILFFVGYNLVNGLKGGIDNAAHIGGLISGLVIGYAFVADLKNTTGTKLKYKTIGILSVVVIFITGWVYKTLPNDIAKYDERIKSFASMESMALEFYTIPKDTPKEKLLSELKERGYYYWNENIKLLKELDQLEIPAELHDQNKQLIWYCELRNKSYHLLYKNIEEDTDKYEDSIKMYDSQIEQIIKDLTKKNKSK